MAQQPETVSSAKSAKRPLRFWLLCAGAGVCGVAAASVVVGWMTVSHVNFGPFVGRRATAMLGRNVSVESLSVTPGRWLKLDLGGVKVANIPGGSKPDMVDVGHLSVEIKLSTLLHGPMLVRHVTGSDIHVLVERTSDRHPNWRFKTKDIPGEASAKPPAPAAEITSPDQVVPDDRSSYPTVLDVQMHNSDVTYRTAHGSEFRSTLNTITLNTKDASSPVSFTVDGAYNGQPVQLDATLQPFDALRQTHKPYGMVVKGQSGDFKFTFDGNATDPLNADGLSGAVTAETPTSRPLMTIAGMDLSQDIPLHMEGQFTHADNFWAVTQGKGVVKNNSMTITQASLMEGERGKPDQVKADVAFDQLNVNSFLGKDGASNPSGADMVLDVSSNPDPLIDAKLSAKGVTYNVYHFSDASLSASVTPGLMAVRNLSLAYLGATLKASGKIAAAEKGNARVQGDVALAKVDIDRFRRALGFKPVPLLGQVDMQMTASATQHTLNAAVQKADIAAAVAMTSGALDKKIIQAASADISMLFNKPKGATTVSCLLGVVSSHGGVGQALPMRIKTADGTLSANARFDLNRRWFDLIFSTQGKTTGRFALDIPVRVSGSFSNPSISLAKWSADGRAMLAQSERLNTLPAGVKQFAQRNACYRAIAP
ncbi:AsmA-like C-terminal region-containing protein [Acetobacter indonesiensis]|uniref:AsmA family protein n=1 Tax=Acetobacter indonesiensis TaxID=104101 RepID=UPI001F1B9B97|nr:AsmA-like C-terminal region-containing protein [Acetobacter indonesiensis]MCG0995211.1 AsmA-like C-terminal region-containing protein [Acetobacter indonesiensis]